MKAGNGRSLRVYTCVAVRRQKRRGVPLELFAHEAANVFCITRFIYNPVYFLYEEC